MTTVQISKIANTSVFFLCLFFDVKRAPFWMQSTPVLVLTIGLLVKTIIPLPSVWKREAIRVVVNSS